MGGKEERKFGFLSEGDILEVDANFALYIINYENIIILWRKVKWQ